MVEVVATNTPEEVAWAAYDRAVLTMHAIYAEAAANPEGAETPSARAIRLQLMKDVERLGDEWRKLFLGDEPRPAA